MECGGWAGVADGNAGGCLHDEAHVLQANSTFCSQVAGTLPAAPSLFYLSSHCDGHLGVGGGQLRLPGGHRPHVEGLQLAVDVAHHKQLHLGALRGQGKGAAERWVGAQGGPVGLPASGSTKQALRVAVGVATAQAAPHHACPDAGTPFTPAACTTAHTAVLDSPATPGPGGRAPRWRPPTAPGCCWGRGTAPGSCAGSRCLRGEREGRGGEGRGGRSVG